jgi:hypothetical protein
MNMNAVLVLGLFFSVLGLSTDAFRSSDYVAPVFSIWFDDSNE